VVLRKKSAIFYALKKRLGTPDLVVKIEDSKPKGCGFEIPLERPLYTYHSFKSNLGKKIVEKPEPGIVALYYCNLTYWRFQFIETSCRVKETKSFMLT
jgi:hypothetical protein